MRKYAFYFLLVLIFTIPWQNTVAFADLGTISRVVGFFAVGVGLIIVLLYKRLIEIPIVIIIMIIFIFWHLLSYFWSIDPHLTLMRIITYTQLLAMVWLIWEITRDSKDGIMLIQAYVIGTYITIIDMFVLYSAGLGDQFRIAATGFNQNEMAVIFAFNIPMAWYLLNKYKSKLLYFVNLFSIPLSIFCIILTASRSGLILSLIGLLIIPMSIFVMKSNIKSIITFIILFLFVLIPLFSPGMFIDLELNIERLLMTTDSIQRGDLSNREVIWKAGMIIASDNILIGVGAGGFAKSIEPIVGSQWVAHNTYLALLVESGIFGFLLFFMIVIVSLLPNLYLPYSEKILCLILFVMLFISFIPGDMETNKITWFVISIYMMNAVYILRNRKFIQVNKVNNI